MGPIRIWDSEMKVKQWKKMIKRQIFSNGSQAFNIYFF